MGKITIRKNVGDEVVESVIDIDDNTSLIVTLDNGKEIELGTVTSKNHTSLFVNGVEPNYYIKPFIQGGILIIPQ